VGGKAPPRRRPHIHRGGKHPGGRKCGFGADHILWGTDTPVIGPPHWQIEAFQTFTIPEQLTAQHSYAQLTPEVKNKIFGENAARIFGIDIAAARKAIESDLLYQLRDDRNPLPAGATPL
jgi:hypothetical protein